MKKQLKILVDEFLGKLFELLAKNENSEIEELKIRLKTLEENFNALDRKVTSHESYLNQQTKIKIALDTTPKSASEFSDDKIITKHNDIFSVLNTHFTALKHNNDKHQQELSNIQTQFLFLVCNTEKDEETVFSTLKDGQSEELQQLIEFPNLKTSFSEIRFFMKTLKDTQPLLSNNETRLECPNINKDLYDKEKHQTNYPDEECKKLAAVISPALVIRNKYIIKAQVKQLRVN